MKKPIEIEVLKHTDAKRTNISTAEIESAMYAGHKGAGRIAVRVIDHLGDEVMKVFGVK